MNGTDQSFGSFIESSLCPVSEPDTTNVMLDQRDVNELRGLLDLMEKFPDNDQRARYLLTSNWIRRRGAAAQANAEGLFSRVMKLGFWEGNRRGEPLLS